MEELRFSIDEEQYDDRHGQVLHAGAVMPDLTEPK